MCLQVKQKRKRFTHHRQAQIFWHIFRHIDQFPVSGQSHNKSRQGLQEALVQRRSSIRALLNTCCNTVLRSDLIQTLGNTDCTSVILSTFEEHRLPDVGADERHGVQVGQTLLVFSGDGQQ